MDIEFMRTTLLEMFTPASLKVLLVDGHPENALPASVESLLATLSGRYHRCHSTTLQLYHFTTLPIYHSLLMIQSYCLHIHILLI